MIRVWRPPAGVYFPDEKSIISGQKKLQNKIAQHIKKEKSPSENDGF